MIPGQFCSFFFASFVSVAGFCWSFMDCQSLLRVIFCICNLLILNMFSSLLFTQRKERIMKS